jgi:hypothetical protein
MSATMDQPTAVQVLRQLEPLAGEWTSEATRPDPEPWPGGGRVTFEWLASGAHLVERGTAELSEASGNVSITATDGRQP